MFLFIIISFLRLSLEYETIPRKIDLSKSASIYIQPVSRIISHIIRVRERQKTRVYNTHLLIVTAIFTVGAHITCKKKKMEKINFI